MSAELLSHPAEGNYGLMDANRKQIDTERAVVSAGMDNRYDAF